MGSKFKKFVRKAAKVVVPIIAAVAAAPVTAAIATSAGLGAIGTAATAGVVSGTLQGGAAGMTGGDVGRAMVLGAAGGAIASGTQSALSASQAGRQTTSAIGSSVQDATIRGASGAVSGGVGAALTGEDVGQGIIGGGTQAAGMSLARDTVGAGGRFVGNLFSGQDSAAPTDMGGAGVLAPTAAPSSNLDFDQSPFGFETSAPLDTPRLTSSAGAGDFRQPTPLVAQPTAGLNVSTSPLDMMNRAVAPQQPALSPLAVSGTTTGVAGSTPAQATTQQPPAMLAAPQQQQGAATGSTGLLTAGASQDVPFGQSPLALSPQSTFTAGQVNLTPSATAPSTPQDVPFGQSPLALSPQSTFTAGQTRLTPSAATPSAPQPEPLTDTGISGVSTSPLEMTDRALAPQQPAPTDMGGAGVLQPGQTLPPQDASDEPTFLQRVWAGGTETAAELGVEYGARFLLGLFTPDPEEPEGPPMINDIDFVNIYEQMSPEERELFDNARQEMNELAETNQELFQERLAISRGLLQEAGYFDPEYFGMMQQRATRTAMAQQERERRREEALSGRAPSDARARQAALDSALAGESAYLQGADFAQQQRLRTMQAAEGMMPTTGPSTLLQHSGTVAGLMAPTYSRLSDQYSMSLDAFTAGEEQRRNLAAEQRARDEGEARTASLYGETFLDGFRNA